MQATQLLGREDPLEKETQPTPVFLPGNRRTEEPGGYSPWGHKRVRYNLEIQQQQIGKASPCILTVGDSDNSLATICPLVLLSEQCGSRGHLLSSHDLGLRSLKPLLLLQREGLGKIKRSRSNFSYSIGSFKILSCQCLPESQTTILLPSVLGLSCHSWATMGQTC